MYIKIKFALKLLIAKFIEIYLVVLEMEYEDTQTENPYTHSFYARNAHIWRYLLLTELAVWSPVCRAGTLEASFSVNAAS